MKKVLCIILASIVFLCLPASAVYAAADGSQNAVWSDASGTYLSDEGNFILTFLLDDRYDRLFVQVTDTPRETTHEFDGYITGNEVQFGGFFSNEEIFMFLNSDGSITITDNSKTSFADEYNEDGWPISYYELNLSDVYTKISDDKPVLTLRMATARYQIPGWSSDEATEEANYIGYYDVPTKIIGTGDEEFDHYVAGYIYDNVEAAAQEYLDDYTALIESADTDPTAMEFAERYYYADELSVLAESNNYYAISKRGYVYTGGAHGLSWLKVYNLGATDKKILSLGDLFNDESYLGVIEGKLSKMSKTEAYKNLLYPDTEEVKIYEDESNFFLSNDNLVIYYHPYDIGPYAAGFINFKIPFAELEGLLKDEFLNAEYVLHVDEDTLFGY